MKRLRMLFAIALFCLSSVVGAMENPVERQNEDPADRVKIEELKKKSFPVLFTEYNGKFADYQNSLWWHSLAFNVSFVAVPATIGFLAMGTRNQGSFSQLMNNLGESAFLGALIQTSQQGIHFGRDKLLRALPLLRLRGKWRELRLREQAIREKVREEKIDLLPYLAGQRLDGYHGTQYEVLVELFNEAKQAERSSSDPSLYFETPAKTVADETWRLLLKLTDPTDTEMVNHGEKALGILIHEQSNSDIKALCEFVAKAAHLPIEFISANSLPQKLQQMIPGQDIFDNVRLEASNLNNVDEETKRSIVTQRRWVSAVAKLHVEHGVMESEKSRGNGEAEIAKARQRAIDEWLKNEVVNGNKLLRSIQQIKKELSRERILLQHYAGNRMQRWYRWAKSLVTDQWDDYTVTQKNIDGLESELQQEQRDFARYYAKICMEARIPSKEEFYGAYEQANKGLVVVENLEELCQEGNKGGVVHHPVADILLETMQKPVNKNVAVIATADRMNHLSNRLKSRENFKILVEQKPMSETQRKANLKRSCSKFNVAPDLKSNLPDIAKKTKGFSQQNLKRIFSVARESALLKVSARMGSEVITKTDATEAIIQVMKEMNARADGNTGSNLEDVLKKGAQFEDDDPKYAGQLPQDVIEHLSDVLNRTEEETSKRNGILLWGPPGTGKTFDARQIAYALGSPIIRVSGSIFGSKWLAESAENVRKLFSTIEVERAKLNYLTPERIETVRKRRAECLPGITNDSAPLKVPLVVFIDEVSALGRNRDLADESGGSQEYVKMLEEFLTGIGDARDLTDVIFIGATNVDVVPKDHSPCKLDAAFLDRFPCRVLVPLPNRDKREIFVQRKLADIQEGSWNPAAVRKIREVLLSDVASGWSLRTIENLWTRVMSKKKTARATQVTVDHISYALGSILQQQKGVLLNSIDLVYERLGLELRALPRPDSSELEEESPAAKHEAFIRSALSARQEQQRQDSSFSSLQPQITAQLTQNNGAILPALRQIGGIQAPRSASATTGSGTNQAQWLRYASASPYFASRSWNRQSAAE